MKLRLLALGAAVVLVAAACGSNRGASGNNNSDNTGGGGTNGQVVTENGCPPNNGTTGVGADTITIGTSLPQSGQYAPFKAILSGEGSYFKYINDSQGGVGVGGKKYKINLVNKDDAYDAARTSANVDALINNNKVFGLFNVVGTKNNLGVRDTVSTACVPNMLIASGAVQWGNPKFPWMIGSELVPYPLEVDTFVNYLRQHKPNATIAILKQNDDFGDTYEQTLKELIKGTQMKIVATQGYDPESSEVKTQVTSLANSHADAFLLAAALLACPNGLTAASDAGWKPITYMSGTCVSKVLFTLAGPAAQGVLSVTPLLDPADPKNDSNPAMQLYKQQMKKYDGAADVQDGIVAYGWTTAALFVKTLEMSKTLDRVTVMNAIRTLPGVSDVALQLPGSKWTTSSSDSFIGETFEMIQYDAKAGHTNAIGGLIDDDGKTGSLSPPALLNS